MKKRLGVISIILALVMTLGATGAFAAVSSVTGNIQLLVTPPTDVRLGAFESDEHIRVFDENHGVFLDSDLLTDDFPGITSQTIPTGTRVNSHLVHFDPTSTSLTTLSGTITFDSAILGLFTTNQGLDNTDGMFGLAGTTYPTGSDRFVEASGSNADGVSYTGSKLTITLKATTGIDQIRVITRGYEAVGGEAYQINKLSVLAPWLALAFVLAAGGGWFVMRRRQARQD